jgi:phage repressor protein C with HTH and peptisase S24 domain
MSALRSVLVTDARMAPRIRPGEFVIAVVGHPCVPGDEVVVVLKDGHLVRNLVSRQHDAIVLSDNQGGTETLAESDVASVLFVGGVTTDPVYPQFARFPKRA